MFPLAGRAAALLTPRCTPDARDTAAVGAAAAAVIGTSDDAAIAAAATSAMRVKSLRTRSA
jgi:hypothetical protein